MNIEQIKIQEAGELKELLLLADPDEVSVNAYIAGAEVFVAREQSEVLAVAVLVMDEPIAELKNIAVAPSHQGQGLAKLLINAVQQAARTLGAESLSVGTGNSSLSQLALYQKCGFRMSNIIPNFFASYPEPIIENGIRCIDMVVLKMEL